MYYPEIEKPWLWLKDLGVTLLFMALAWGGAYVLYLLAKVALHELGCA